MKIPRQISLKKAATIILISVLLTVIGSYYAFAATPTSTFTISPGIYPGAPTYTIWTEGGYYFIKDSHGKIVYSGSDAPTVINYAINHVPVKRSVIYIKSGIYVLNSPVEITSYREDLRIVGGRDTWFNITNNDCGILIGAGSKISIEGLNLRGIEGYNAYGIRVIEGTSLTFKDIVGYQLNNWMFLFNASYRNVNYIFMENIYCIESYGCIKQMQDIDEHQYNSMSILATNIIVTHCERGIYLEMNDATFNGIIGEADFGDFIQVNASACHFYNVNIEASQASTIHVLAGKHNLFTQVNIWNTKYAVNIESGAKDVVIDGLTAEEITGNIAKVSTTYPVYFSGFVCNTSGITPLDLVSDNKVSLTDSYFVSQDSQSLYNNKPYKMHNVRFNKAGTVYYSENSGSISFNGYSALVTHHLIDTPSLINVSPKNSGYGEFYVTSVDSSTFTISVVNSGDYTFYWYASVTG